MWVRECEGQWLTGENAVDWRFVGEGGGIEFVLFSRVNSWCMLILKWHFEGGFGAAVGVEGD